jgi:hypothetical protein
MKERAKTPGESGFASSDTSRTPLSTNNGSTHLLNGNALALVNDSRRSLAPPHRALGTA